MSKRYEIIADEFGYWIVDSAIWEEADGETPANVDGAFTRAEAEAKLADWNKGKNS